MKTTCRLLVLLVACTAWMPSQSQKTKSIIQLADQYFATGEYYTAAHLYEQFLNPPRKQKSVSNFPLSTMGKRKPVTNKVSRVDILFKQAESYRLANYWQKAAVSYKECAEKEPIRHVNALYWHAVCERSLGHYAAAEENLKQYLSSTNTNNQYKEAAEKELQTLAYIQQQLGRPDSILIKFQKLSAPNSSEKGVFAPVYVSGNQFLVSSTQKDSLQVNGTNPYRSRLFYATLNNGSLEEMTPVTLPASDPTNNQGAAAISADRNALYFSQWKKENGRTVSSIYFTKKQAEGWSSPVLLSSVNIDGYSSKQPFCSPDGKYLFFASDRPNGSGKYDIWYAPLQEDGNTGEPVNAGTAVNTIGDEQAPFYHNNSTTLVFSSNGRPGMGGYDLFAAKGSQTSWTQPENLGHPVNSSRDDIYFFAQEKAGLLSNAIFSSDRGEGCCLETYSISKTPKSKRLTGILRDCKDSAPVADAEVVLKDAAGKTSTVRTNTDGRYIFDVIGDDNAGWTLAFKKELYNDTASSLVIEHTDESDLLTDKIMNRDLCVEKTPVIPPADSVIAIKVEDVVTLYFDFDKSALKPASISHLDSIFNVLLEYPTATIQISGYTDGLGNEVYNKMLSDKRAKACADYLTGKGIDSTRITFVSFGSCCPVEMEIINGRDNSGGRSRNRRALINIKRE